jgi:hypothetical protein
LNDRSEKQEERRKVKQIILSQLKSGPKYRLELHHEVCSQLGYDTKPLYNQKGNLSRICEGMTDNTFDAPLNELKDSKMVKWHRGNRKDGHSVVFYELTEQRQKRGI